MEAKGQKGKKKETNKKCVLPLQALRKSPRVNQVRHPCWEYWSLATALSDPFSFSCSPLFERLTLPSGILSIGFSCFLPLGGPGGLEEGRSQGLSPTLLWDAAPEVDAFPPKLQLPLDKPFMVLAASFPCPSSPRGGDESSTC